MSRILGPNSATKIYFMEGFDGAAELGAPYEKQWIRYKMWHTASHDLNSPSSQPPITASVPIIIDSGFPHAPDNAYPGGAPAGEWYQGEDRYIVMTSPYSPYEDPWQVLPNKSKNGLIWRSGSNTDEIGEEGLYNQGLREIASGSTVYCGFGFRFGDVAPDEDCCGILKVWMGDSANNGMGSNGAVKYAEADPGEPSQLFNGFAGGATHAFQEARLCLEITTGSGAESNITIYRTNTGPGGTATTDWEATAPVKIQTGKWYWGAWEVLPKGPPDSGYTAFYLDNELILEVNDQCKDGTSAEGDNMRSSEIISNLAFAFRGPLQGGQGEDFSGKGICWTGVPAEFHCPVTNRVQLDDVTLFHEKDGEAPLIKKGPLSTYCVILKAEEPANPATFNFDPVNAATIWSAISESSDPVASERVPYTSSYVFTDDDPNDNLLSIRYLEFPWYHAGVQPTEENTIIHGVQPLTFCSRATADFRFCTQSLEWNLGGFAAATAEIPVEVGLPGTGADGNDDPYVYICNWVHPTCSLGSGPEAWSPERINELSSSAILGD